MAAVLDVNVIHSIAGNTGMGGIGRSSRPNEEGTEKPHPSQLRASPPGACSFPPRTGTVA